MINPEELRTRLADIDPDILLADGFEGAFIGVTAGIGACRAVYDVGKCIDMLVQAGDSYEDAVAFVEFNVCGAYVGEYTPVFIDLDLGKQLAEGGDHD